MPERPAATGAQDSIPVSRATPPSGVGRSAPYHPETG